MTLRRYLSLAALLLWPALAGAAEPAAKGLRYPCLTPDGKSVVFCYRGDLWIAPTDGSRNADRLTIHEDQDTLCRVSPDGKSVAFSSRRNGGYDLFVVPMAGGLPKQITFHGGVEILCEWSPDGKRILFMSNRDPGGGRTDLYEVDLEGGTPRRITRDGAREAAYSPDGTKIAYVRGFNDIYWDNYQGSANYDIHVVDAKGGTPRRLTSTPGNERFPCWSADGKTIWFVAEENGVANFYAMPAEGGPRTAVTKYQGNDLQRPCLAYDRRTAVFELAGQLFTADLTAPAEKPTPLKINIESDVRNSGVEVRTITSGGEQVHVSADGRTLAFTLRGDIWTMPSAGGNARRVTQGPANDQWPRLSPDGQRIAYFSNQSGNNDIYILELRTGQTRAVTNSRADEFFQNWSPDGKRLVFCREINGNKDIWTIHLESGQEAQLTREPAPDDDPSWSPDGQLIVFDSGRGGTQDIYVMNADGSGVRQVTQGAAFFQVPSFSPDGRMIVFESFQPGSGQSGGLFVVGAQGGQTMQISRDGTTACWSPDGSTIFFAADRGGDNNGIFRVPAPTSIGGGERVPFVGTVEVDLKQELGNLFDEAWTALRDGFYDAKMHKVDWNQMKTKYRDIAIDTENKEEFQNVIRQMLAELGASHLGISGGSRPGSSVTPPGEQTGYLGVEFAETPAEGGARLIERVIPGGPGDKAGLRVGDVVTRIGKETLQAKTNLDLVLAGLVGKDTAIAYRPASAAGLGDERTLSLKPLGWNQIADLEYQNWVSTCAKRVQEATKGADGEVAYIHLSQMDPGNLLKFQQAIASWSRDKRKLGLILDVRNNGGGNIHQQLISILQSRPLAEVQMRGGPRVPQPQLYWDRPVVVLINERSFSDAEVFPYMFRAAGLGQIVGVPTAGGVIGTNDITLSDGSRFRVPRTGFWGMDGTNLEGLGVKPDILVEETAEDRLQGRDPQLAKAIEVVRSLVKTPATPKTETPKPVPAPAPTPTPTPTPENPTAAAPGLDTLADATAGEWVRYRALVPGQEGESVIKVMVSRIEGGTVFFAKEIEKGRGDLVPLPDQMERKPVLEVLKGMGQLLGHDLFEGKVAEATVAMVRAKLKWPDGTEIACTFTNAVPAYGLLKVEIGKSTVLEAIEWGVPKPATPEVASVPPAPPAPPPAPAEAAPARPPHPIWDAKAGEWLKFRRPGPNGREMELKLTVASVSDDEVVLDQVVSVAGREMPGPQLRRPRQKELVPPGDLPAESYGKETLTVAGQTFECIVMTAVDPQGGRFKYWHCVELPVNGLVRMEREGELVLELLAWGNG